MWGYKLGEAVHGIRRGFAHKDKREDLTGIGFDFNKNDRIEIDYDRKRRMLLRYKELYGDMRVPCSFIIPSNDDDWPDEEMWGYRLGIAVKRIRRSLTDRDKREDLIDKGFEFENNEDNYNLKRRMLLRYKELYGHVRIPYSFIIPTNDDSWPKEMWGYKLGAAVKGIRSGLAHKDKRKDLISIGFVFDIRDDNYDLKRRMLLKYKELHGDMLVPQSFVIPSNDNNWPDEEMWGYKLGRAVSKIRCGHAHKDKRKDLMSIGFVFKKEGTTTDYDLKRRMLLKYKELYGDMKVPQSFIIPTNDGSWPKEMWGYKLGNAVSVIRNGEAYAEYRDDLLSIGFTFEKRRMTSYDSKRRMLLKYKELYGDMLIPDKFVIPSNDDKWPEEMWGYRLGQAAKNIRSGLTQFDRQDLLRIGFEFHRKQGISDGNYNLKRRMLLRYKELYGNMRVPQSFVIPSNDDNWPDEEMWGYKLGTAVNGIRYDKAHKDKREDLISIGFEFNKSERNEVDYDLKRRMLLRYKELYGDMRVPCSFIIPSNDDNWPDEEMWGYKLGTAVNSIRCGRAHADKREDLISIGFDFIKSERIERDFSLMRRMLLKYKELYGDMKVPTKFIIPPNDENWPDEEMWGYNLGKAVNNIRCCKRHIDKHADLIGIGFVLNNVTADYGFKRRMLLRYKELYGHMLVPINFVVPSRDDNWPREMWGFQLGQVVSNIRSGKAHKDKREDLIRIGFVFEKQNLTTEYDLKRRMLL
jgi:hypothetical protein